MRTLLWTVSVVALCVGPAAAAQSAPEQSGAPTVNQRLTSPTSQADTYMGVSLGQLIMALGLTLRGVDYQANDIRMIRRRQMAEVPLPQARRADPPPSAPGIAGTATPGNLPLSP